MGKQKKTAFWDMVLIAYKLGQFYTPFSFKYWQILLITNGINLGRKKHEKRMRSVWMAIDTVWGGNLGMIVAQLSGVNLIGVFLCI